MIYFCFFMFNCFKADGFIVPIGFFYKKHKKKFCFSVLRYYICFMKKNKPLKVGSYKADESKISLAVKNAKKNKTTLSSEIRIFVENYKVKLS